MMKKVLYNLMKTFQMNGTIPEKLTLIKTLLSLSFKQTFHRRSFAKKTERIFNYKVATYDYSTLNYLIQEVFLSNDYHFDSVNKSPVIIDCGANIGMATLLYKRLFPDSTILAFEPNPHTYALLKENIEVNKIKGVETFNVALMDSTDEISFFINDDPGTLVGSAIKSRGGSHELKVKCMQLSGFISTYPKIDLLKIDVEGAEKFILNDLLRNNCFEKINEMIIEYHHFIDGEPNTLPNFLRIIDENGFKYNIKANFKKIGSFQDLLIHCYRI